MALADDLVQVLRPELERLTTELVQRSLRWLDRAAGALFVGFGIRLALTAAPQP